MPLDERRYSSYLLRLWWAEADGETSCRIALESTQDGARWVFANLDALLMFLKTPTGRPELPHGGNNA
jgi:hypothetical protein